MAKTISEKLRAHIWYVVIVYLCLGVSWVLFSDSLILHFFSYETGIKIQLYKGLLFVIITALLLYFILYQKNKSIERLFTNMHRNMKTFQSTFEQSAVGMAHVSIDNKLIRINQKMCSILGYTREELQKMQTPEFVHAGDQAKSKKKDEKLKSGEIQNYVIEKQFITKSGKRITGRLTKTAIKNDAGEVQYLTAILEDITPQKKIEEELAESLYQKEKLLNEVHHRVKNNLAVISGLLELQTFNSSDKMVKRILKGSLMRIKSMALIHESYYKSGTLTEVSINEYLDEFSAYIQRNFSSHEAQITLDYSADAISLNINQAIPCGLLLNELLVNVYQHAFKNQKKGQMSVYLRQLGNKIILRIEDNGVGLPDSVSVQNPSSLGMTIIHTLVKQLNGSISVQQDEKTEFIIDFIKVDKSGSASNLTENSVV